MSWSEYFTNIDADQVLESQQPSTEASEEHQEQFAVARAAASRLIDSGLVGDPAKFLFNVTLSGHGNPNHEPTPGWANDCIAINVSQAGPKEVSDGGEG
jgi:hypothetical protein